MIDIYTKIMREVLVRAHKLDTVYTIIEESSFKTLEHMWR